ncbi:type VI secretion system protein [Acinetobacter sp. ANC 5054]|uniref:type VI secretion system Vgr family protein n=1 Tax=Acinetobacter sp. ANC 5054 TaxID=1977877 RepID=UPI000A343F51|nr:type VI secretion system Vgr family protein [Acinetobacter sp. ANC 5054]OTG79325.1 type VI secretion system protein [Acinetobacter sp. ANC 5054]
MLNNIYAALEQLGISPQKRALHIQFSNTALNEQVFIQRIDGEHALSEGLNVQLICLSTSATLELKQFIGAQVAIDQVTDTGQLFRLSGIITEAFQGQSDGALTLYRLTLQDATALWHKRRNSRVFMNKSVKDVVQTIFTEWQKKSALFAASLSLDLSGLQQDYDTRPFIMQSNETDYDFISRLLRSEGIHWLVDEAQHFVASSSAPLQPQKLRLIDENSQYQALDRRNIRFHRSSATEKKDSMTSFIGQRRLQPTSVHVQRWQADILEQDEGGGAVQTKHSHSQNQDNASLSLEQAWHVSPAWMQDLNGEDGATAASSSQVERINQNLTDYYAAQAKQFIAKSTVRDTHVGYWFKLDEHPEIDQHRGADQEFLILSKSFYNQNNLPKDLTDQVTQLIHQSQWQVKQSDVDERQANTLALQRRNISTVPEYNPLAHRPATHPQRAKVVGPAGEEIHVDEWGRIKVRFLFTRSDDHGHDGGAGANNNDTDSAWVDVLTSWAGEGYGARFLPRIGEIVVVDFFDGNIDRPFVVGRIHEAQRSPTKFDNKGKLPDTKKLAGIRSKEVAGEGFGQLRFDDTTGQISTQLQSSHGTSQLNLGKLSHPKDKPESEDRGEGFELRTDQWGAVRAGQGLLVSTYKQDGAKGEHLDVNEAKSQIESSLKNSKALSEVAKNQQTDPLDVLEGLQAFIEVLSQKDEKKAAEFKSAVMVLASPNSIALSSNEDVHISAVGLMSHTAGESINISAQKSLIGHAGKKISLFAAQEGLRAFAGKGKVEIQAQGDGADFIARKGIQIISTEDTVYITSPKEINLTAGGSQIKLNGSGVFPTTGGKFEAKAGQHKFVEGEKVEVPPIKLNSSPCYLTFEIVDEFGKPGQGIEYVVFKSDGTQKIGKTDANGRTERFETDGPEQIGVHISDKDASKYKIMQNN